MEEEKSLGNVNLPNRVGDKVLHTDELQSVLLSYPEVEDAFVIDTTNQDKTEKVKAFVVRKRSINEHDLASFISEKHPSYEQLKEKIQFHFIEKIPKDDSGKVLSQELEERELNRTTRMNGIRKGQDDTNIVKSKYPNVKIPDDMSWSEFIMQHFEEYGDKRALTDIDRQRFYTYAELHDLVKRCCSGLIKAGLKKGDVLGMYCPNIPEYPIIYLATLQAGGIVTTANPLYTEDELTHQLQIANTKYLVTIPSLAHRAKASAKNVGIDKVLVVGKTEGCLSVSELFKDDGSMYNTVEIIPKEDIAVMPFSSGTTGFPKGVLLTHYNLIADACITTADGFINYSTSSTILGLLPFFHTYGMVAVLSVGLYRGSCVVCIPKFERDKFFYILQEHKISMKYDGSHGSGDIFTCDGYDIFTEQNVTHVALVPPIAMMIAKSTTLHTYDLSHLVEVTSGAAPLALEISREFSDRIPQIKMLRQGYGMTELSPVSHMTAQDNTKHGTVGHLLSNLECKVVDVGTGKTVGVGKDGEICIRGPTVMKGYLNNPEATKNSKDEEGWLRTGDIGHYDLDECFYIVDRMKELIKYKGYQVPPAELEALLVSHPKISDAAVIGIPDDEAGQLPRAYVVTNGNISESDILTFVEENVASYKKLRGGIEFISEVPRSLSGKILRRELRDLYKKKGEKNKETNAIRRHTLVRKQPDTVVQVKNSSCCIVL